MSPMREFTVRADLGALPALVEALKNNHCAPLPSHSIDDVDLAHFDHIEGGGPHPALEISPSLPSILERLDLARECIKRAFQLEDASLASSRRLSSTKRCDEAHRPSMPRPPLGQGLYGEASPPPPAILDPPKRVQCRLHPCPSPRVDRRLRAKHPDTRMLESSLKCSSRRTATSDETASPPLRYLPPDHSCPTDGSTWDEHLPPGPSRLSSPPCGPRPCHTRQHQEQHHPPRRSHANCNTPPRGCVN